MEKHRFIIVFGGILILTILVVFLSCHYFSQIKNEQILKATYLFSHAVDLEKELMQPEFISFPKSYTGISSDFTIWETTYYRRMKSHGSIREWYRGTGLRPYLSALNTKELHAFEEEILCV